VALDARLWLRDEIGATLDRLRALTGALIGLAERHAGVLAPGHTHFQPAQPVLLAPPAGLRRMLLRDAARSGTPRPHGGADHRQWRSPGPRPSTAGRWRDLGLPVTANSLDAVSDRDFVVEFVFCASLAMTLPFRGGLIIWCTRPSAGPRSPTSTAGSSLMPQKKNPDMAGWCAANRRVTGHLVRC
jgi:argininosuccinate lyase